MSKITLSVWNKINHFSKKNKLFNFKDRVLLAVSGGPDSMMMLHYFDKTFKGYFAVFHLNHMIRSSSFKDEEIVRDYCKKNSITFFCERFDVKKNADLKKENLEDFARKVRYKFLLKYSKALKCNIVATAHNMDENIETILLNMIRGVNPEGLCGIPIKRLLSKGIYVVRPVLCIKKDEIYRYLKENKIDYTIDETNFDTTYTRNWLRHKIIPEIERRFPGFGLHLIELSNNLRRRLKLR